jgi:hypothetical protein
MMTVRLRSAVGAAVHELFLVYAAQLSGLQQVVARPPAARDFSATPARCFA